MNWRLVLLRIPLYSLAFYGVLCAALYFLQEKLLFPREPGNFSDCSQMTKLGASPKEIDGLRFYEKTAPQNKTTVVVFHGNGGTACDRSWILEGLQDLPLNFVSVEYPGYAQANPASPAPSEKIILDQAKVLIAKLELSGTKIILFGESLGSGVATFGASIKNISGLILQAPYTSLADVGQFHYRFFPVRYLSRFPFRAAIWASLVKSPVLILRAGKDEIIPPKITDAQIKNFEGKIQVVEFPTASHNTMEMTNSQLYWQSVRSFVQPLL